MDLPKKKVCLSFLKTGKKRNILKIIEFLVL